VHASLALLQYLAQVRGVPSHSCHATLAYKRFVACIQPPLAACTLKNAYCTSHLLVAGIHVTLKIIRGGVHVSTKLHLLSSWPGVYSRTTQIETLLMSLTASFSTYTLRVVCHEEKILWQKHLIWWCDPLPWLQAASEAAGTFLGGAEEDPKRQRRCAEAHGGGGA